MGSRGSISTDANKDFISVALGRKSVGIYWRQSRTTALWRGIRVLSTCSLTRPTGVGLTDAGLCEIIRPRRREVQHEIPNCSLGGCGLSRCEWVGGLFLGG